MSDRSDIPGPVRDVPLNLVSELLRVVPRLVDRTRSQAELVTSLAGHLPCLGGLLAGPAHVDGVGEDDAAERATDELHEQVPIDVISLLERDPSDDVPAPATATKAAAPTGQPSPAGAPSEAELPIQDYDSLAASQVVPRLATLSHEELRSVRSYELAHRNRQTILNRVAQRLAD